MKGCHWYQRALDLSLSDKSCSSCVASASLAKMMDWTGVFLKAWDTIVGLKSQAAKQKAVMEFHPLWIDTERDRQYTLTSSTFLGKTPAMSNGSLIWVRKAGFDFDYYRPYFENPPCAELHWLGRAFCIQKTVRIRVWSRTVTWHFIALFIFQMLYKH